MKFKNIALGLFLGMAAFTSCDKGFDELNTNPNDPVSVPSGLLTADVVRIAANQQYSTFWGGDMGACWAQQWAKVQYNSEAMYEPREGVIETTIWKTYYEDVIADARTMEDLATAEENPAMQGVAWTMQAYGFSVLTDMFGDIPFSEALRADEAIFAPAYDRQQDVYTGILAMLDQANTAFEAGEGEINATSDILYGGNTAMWQKFANSLKFRALMRISGKTDVSAQLTELMNRPMFTSNSEEAKLTYLAADPNANPIYETIVFGNRNEWKVNSVLVEMLEAKGDPRLPVYAQINDAGIYRGKPAGIFDVPSDDYSYANVSPIGAAYLAPEAPGYFVSYSELEFLMAEAAMKGFISGDAATHYNAGVQASFDANNLGSASAYLGSNPYVDMTSIGEQKWLALFCQGAEAWTEWRRTGIPALQPALEADLGAIPSRYTYPAIEQSVNSASLAAAIANQGPNLLTTKVWWME